MGGHGPWVAVEIRETSHVSIEVELTTSAIAIAIAKYIRTS